METGQSLLLTKLLVPQVRANRGARPGLVTRLNQALNGKLTLVSAPAGFGKATLVEPPTSRPGKSKSWTQVRQVHGPKEV